jgi:hypothetical protein
MIKATTTTRLPGSAPPLSLHVTHEQRDRLESWGSMPAPPRPLEADQGAGTDMISEKSRVQREHKCKLVAARREEQSSHLVSPGPIFTSCSREPKLPLVCAPTMP